jgi:hypothetical protein
MYSDDNQDGITKICCADFIYASGFGIEFTSTSISGTDFVVCPPENGAIMAYNSYIYLMIATREQFLELPISQ